ncbi:LytTR family transcriptional regulator DNA-binding domain-containing protein [Psychroflexus sp. MES1-P1E]|uniref:LytTR family transcriptional regulator DNA-binding domain-containing protein n=1 Tax=Psychroflexus sp. MES1-P1E TaxID=2058320 RepID=UPI000C79ACA5|nr:hypothetical protein CXF67_03215 [Psychroflexus sp. MES1-P1E]
MTLNISEIKYIQTIKGLTKIFINNRREPIITTFKLDRVLIDLPDYFWQIHNSFLLTLV